MLLIQLRRSIPALLSQLGPNVTVLGARPFSKEPFTDSQYLTTPKHS